MFFDTRALFEQWLTSLKGIAPAVSESASKEIRSFTESNCEVIFEGVLQVDSLLKGNIRSAYGTLVMSEQGKVEADVDVRIAIVDGCIEGNLRATEFVVLERNARVAGNIHTPSLQIKDGAVFEGTSFFLERGTYSEIQKVETETEASQVSAVGA